MGVHAKWPTKPLGKLPKLLSTASGGVLQRAMGKIEIANSAIRRDSAELQSELEKLKELHKEHDAWKIPPKTWLQMVRAQALLDAWAEAVSENEKVLAWAANVADVKKKRAETRGANQGAPKSPFANFVKTQTKSGVRRNLGELASEYRSLTPQQREAYQAGPDLPFKPGTWWDFEAEFLPKLVALEERRRPEEQKDAAAAAARESLDALWTMRLSRSRQLRNKISLA